VRALDRKLLRDLRRMWAQVLSIALLVAAGVMTVVTMLSTYDSIADSRRAYYEAYRFADVFARLERAPEPLARRIEALAGVMAVRTRIVREVLLDVPGFDDVATARLVSMPVPHEPVLNDVYLRSGRWLEPERPDEVVASERFAEANAAHCRHRAVARVRV
jgi:putative ABC transport system permease protein